MTKKKSTKKSNVLKRVKFVYAPEISKNRAREVNFKNNLNMWLSPYIKEINRQKGKAVVYFVGELENKFSLEGITLELKKKAVNWFYSHQTDVLYL